MTYSTTNVYRMKREIITLYIHEFELLFPGEPLPKGLREDEKEPKGQE